MNRNLQVGVLQVQGDHPVARTDGTKDWLWSLHVQVRRGDVVVQGRQVDDGAPRPRRPSGRGIDGCRNPETKGLVLLPPSEEGSEAPGLRRLPWWTVGSTPVGREDARIEEVDGRRGSDNRPAEPPLPKRPPPEPSKPTRSWLGSRRPPMRDKAPTSENPPVSGGVRRTSSGSANHPSYQTAVWEGEEDRCAEDCREEDLAGPLWPKS